MGNICEVKKWQQKLNKKWPYFPQNCTEKIKCLWINYWSLPWFFFQIHEVEKVVTNGDKTSNLINIALKFQKLQKNFPSFCWKSDGICQRKKSLINVQGTQHPHYYMYVDIEWLTYSHECDPMHFYTIHAYHYEESDTRYKSVSKQAQIVYIVFESCMHRKEFRLLAHIYLIQNFPSISMGSPKMARWMIVSCSGQNE